jgi:hypothetical protein
VITIRVSSLAGYHDCARRTAAQIFWHEVVDAGFRLRYLPRGIGAIVGTVVHRAAADMLGRKARTGTLPGRVDAVARGREILDDQVADIEVIFDGPNGQTHNMADAVDQTVKMVAVYNAAIAPTVNPILIEERLEAEVEPGLVLSGQPDLVAREPGAIRDLKTGARPPASFAPQLGGYSLLARTHGLSIERAAIDFIARVRPRKPQPAPTTHEAVIAHAETAAATIVRNIAADLATFRKGDPARRIQPGDPWAFPANPRSMLCSARFCPAYGTPFCLEGRTK